MFTIPIFFSSLNFTNTLETISLTEIIKANQNLESNPPYDISQLFESESKIFFVIDITTFETQFKLSPSETEQNYEFKSSYTYNKQGMQNVVEVFDTYKYKWGTLFLINELELKSIDKEHIENMLGNMIVNVMNMAGMYKESEVWVSLTFFENMFKKVKIDKNVKDWLDEKLRQSVRRSLKYKVYT